MAALHADERSNPSFAMDALDIVRGEREFESFRVARDQLVHHIYLLQHGLDGGRAFQFDRDVHRPKLSANTSGAQTRDISDQRSRELARVMGQVDLADLLLQLAELPRQIVVAVN